MVGQQASLGARRRSIPRVLLGTVLFIASETMFFAGLFAAYFALRAEHDVWPPPDVELGLAEPVVLTALLLLSSVTAHAAGRAARAGRPARIRSWLTITIALGVGFLGLTIAGWLGESFSISTHAYGTLFFGITGFHALHVAIGLVLFGIVLAVALRGDEERRRTWTEASVSYWHFVDVIWLGVFSTLYLVR